MIVFLWVAEAFPLLALSNATCCHFSFGEDLPQFIQDSPGFSATLLWLIWKIEGIPHLPDSLEFILKENESNAVYSNKMVKLSFKIENESMKARESFNRLSLRLSSELSEVPLQQRPRLDWTELSLKGAARGSLSLLYSQAFRLLLNVSNASKSITEILYFRGSSLRAA